MKTKAKERDDDLRPEYDFASMKGGVTGKYLSKYREGTNVVLLDPDVAQVFRDGRSVNEALRSLIEIARARVPARKRGPHKPLQPTH